MKLEILDEKHSTAGIERFLITTNGFSPARQKLSNVTQSFDQLEVSGERHALSRLSHTILQ